MPTKPTVYDNVPATPEQAKIMADFRAHIKILDLMIRDLCPKGRNQSVALTNLELVQVYFNKGVTHDEPEPNAS